MVSHMSETSKNYVERRKNFVEVFEGNTVLTDTIPSIASALMYDEFGINFYDKSHIPIVFTLGWTEILKFVGSQTADEFAIDVNGVSLEYVTEYSKSDKSTNIVPQLIHKKLPLFIKQTHQVVPGRSFNDELNAKYNSWRSVNLAETMDKIERDVFAMALEEYGVHLGVSATVLPLMAATYAAGHRVAMETKQTVNMYNIFEIDIIEDGGKTILTPLSIIKQYLKNDSKC